MSNLYLIGIVIAFFLTLLLISKKNKSEADKILALWLVATGLHLLFFYLYFSGKYMSFPYLLGYDMPFPLLFGPFLFLYTSSLTNQMPHEQWKKYIHFAPFFLAYVPFIPFILLPSHEKALVYQAKGEGYEVLLSILSIVILISGVTYNILSLLKLKKHRKNISEQFSYTEKINLTWLRYLLFGSCIIWSQAFFGNDEYLFAFVALFVLFIGFFGIKQVGIFTSQTPLLLTQTERRIQQDAQTNSGMKIFTLELPKDKYAKSGLSSAAAENIHKELQQVMEKEKLFSDPELTLAGLAEKLQVHPNILSQVINSLEQKTFYDYINALRVEEFKQTVLHPGNAQFTLLSLAFACGFNSKTSFNRNFKKATNLSPSEYLKQENIQLRA